MLLGATVLTKNQRGFICAQEQTAMKREKDIERHFIPPQRTAGTLKPGQVMVEDLKSGTNSPTGSGFGSSSNLICPRTISLCQVPGEGIMDSRGLGLFISELLSPWESASTSQILPRSSTRAGSWQKYPQQEPQKKASAPRVGSIKPAPFLL